MDKVAWILWLIYCIILPRVTHQIKIKKTRIKETKSSLALGCGLGFAFLLRGNFDHVGIWNRIMEGFLLRQGSWKSFAFKAISAQDFGRALDHLHTAFYIDEPTQTFFGMPPERQADLDDRLIGFLREGISFMAISEETNEVAGVTILTRCCKERNLTTDESSLIATARSPISLIVRRFIGSIEAEVDVFSEYGVDLFGDIFALSVDKKFRKHGLGTKMFELAIEFFKTEGYPILMCVASSPHTRSIMEKFNFKEVLKRHYKDAKSAEGTQTFPTAGENDFITVGILDIRQK